MLPTVEAVIHMHRQQMEENDLEFKRLEAEFFETAAPDLPEARESDERFLKVYDVYKPLVHYIQGYFYKKGLCHGLEVADLWKEAASAAPKNKNNGSNE